ncbi:hypothetical protein [Spirillospora sp. NPDC029432]|uniref:hypothetical protein n=1 Tax=Spirillospora sp. NPDC029432 TaxID=3154599 RepID=UPI003456F2AB
MNLQETAIEKSKVTRAARPLPAPGLPPHFERACRDFLAAGEAELAAWAFGEARRAEENHPALRDMERLHDTYLEFVPAGAVAPTVLRAHIGLMAEHLSPDIALDRFHEILEKAFAAGVVPYARMFTDLRTLAKAAGVRKRDAENGLAARLLRAGALSAAPYTVWNAAGPALARVAAKDDDLLKLLLAADTATEKVRQIRLSVLADAGAGAHVDRKWFRTVAYDCDQDVLMALADQAGSRLKRRKRFPPGDPAIPVTVPDYSAADTRDRDAPLFWNLDTDFGKAATEADLPEKLDAFVLDLDAIDKDGPALLRRALSAPGIRRVLNGLAAGWAAEAATESVPDLRHALARLLPLVQSGFTVPDLEIADPRTALLRTLRGGIPAELALPRLHGRNCWKEETTVLQNGDHLAIAWRYADVAVLSRGEVLDRPDIGFRLREDDIGFWYGDDGTLYRGRLHDGEWQNFRATERGLTLDPDNRFPSAPATAEVTFPGAREPSTVGCAGGVLTLTAPDGTVTARLPFSSRQLLSGFAAVPVVPPGWWKWLSPVDPDGSAALRALGADQADALLDAALTGPRAAAEALTTVLPELTSAELRTAVAETACAAADCVRLSAALRAVLEDRPVARSVPFVSAAGRLTRILEEAAGLPAGPYLIGEADRPVPNWTWHTFGTLGARALRALWPWTEERHRVRAVESLRGWAATPLGDGSGRWRLLRLDRAGQGHELGLHELWRTTNGALLIVRPYEAVEYAPGARFGPPGLDGWAVRDETAQGWGGAAGIDALTRLLTERGPVRPDPSWAHELAERAGIPLPNAAAICFGSHCPEGAPGPIRALYDGEAAPVDFRVEDAAREHLIPADPAAIWTGRLDIEGAARRLEDLVSR